MKELEALKKIEKLVNQNYIKYCQDDKVRKDAYTLEDEVYKLTNEIKQSITPPTSDEVCKALSEYLKEDVIYREQWGFITKNEMRVAIYLGIDNKINFNTSYPPHETNIVSRFYEGLEK